MGVDLNPLFWAWGWFLCSRKSYTDTLLEQRITRLEFTVPTRFITPDVFSRRGEVFGKGMDQSKPAY